jgi:hypothetical protein
MKEPRLVIDDFTQGAHNLVIKNEEKWRDLSTICIIPCGQQMPTRVVQNWLSLQSPMNQKFIRIFASNFEVGVAYSKAIEGILAHPILSTFKYILTLEHDNTPPQDGLLKLYDGMDEYDVIGGLYFTKGEGGKPMCYGKVDTEPHNCIPFSPEPNSITPCNGLGMGFTLFKMDIFKNPELDKPFFRTVQEVGRQYTQDLEFFERAQKLGYKFACDSRVKVGHYDLENDLIW